MACLRPRRYPSPIRHISEFLATVADICRSEGIEAVVPLDEDIVRLLAERGSEIGDVVVVGPNATQYRALSDKLSLSRTAQALGLNSAQTVSVDETGPDGAWPPLPCIVKARTSRSEEGRARMVATEAQRDDYVAALVGLGVGAIVQECVDGPRFVIQSVRGPDSFEYVTFEVLDDWPRAAGPAALKRIVEPPEPVVLGARALLDHVGYVGPSGISFLSGGGRFCPHDVNLRLGATSPASIHAGFDFPRRAVETVLGLQGESFSGRWQPGLFMRLDLELQALSDALRTRKQGGAPAAVLRRIVSVGLSRRGKLAPSPVDPIWTGIMFAHAMSRVARAARSRFRTKRGE